MNDIIVPAERLASLLRAEYELRLLTAGGVNNWSGFYESRQRLDGGMPSLSSFKEDLKKHLENGTLAEEFGFEENGDSEVNVVIDDAGDNACVGE